ncbi:hypothetical protein LTR64_000123 [Lithohypha guttulata]|uniref:uncharacterized protein n=1 Tax=Lithohypha guttulata TaxID=1690604 RepID=UPI002DE1DEA4|nr:hypothetical protein LTR51_007485 [Lithohypha guttulata]
MPNISFDIFFDQDFINVSASRGKHAPKAKPEWKVRTAPKLPPKEQPADPAGTPRPTPRPPINSTRPPARLAGKQAEQKLLEDKAGTSDTASQAGEKAKRKPPKLGPKKTDQPNGTGSFAGGTLNTVGNGINGVGSTINGTIKRYGDGVRDYGNGVMDWANAPAARGQTASNPLGLSGSKAAGKTSVTSPSIYSAPAMAKQSASKTLTTTAKSTQPQKKIGGVPAKKQVAGAVSKPVGAVPSAAKKAVSTVPRAVTNKVPQSPRPGAFKSTQTANKPALPSNPATMQKPVGGPVRASTASVTKAKPPAAKKPNYTGAANPLGLTF